MAIVRSCHSQSTPRRLITHTAATMNQFPVSVLLLCAVFVPGLRANADEGWSDALRNELPYHVHIQTGKRTCEGVLINKNFALTSAQCTDGREAKHLRVTAGQLRLNNGDDGAVKRTVKKIVRHSGWNSNSSHNDLALLRFNEPLTVRASVQAIRLVEPNTNTTGYVMTSGWGRKAEKLRKVYLPLVSHEDCARRYKELNYAVYGTQICAGYKRGAQCWENPGAPLVTHNGKHHLLVGIVSIGPGCMRHNLPGVYTNIAKYNAWIDKNSHK